MEPLNIKHNITGSNKINSNYNVSFSGANAHLFVPYVMKVMSENYIKEKDKYSNPTPNSFNNKNFSNLIKHENVSKCKKEQSCFHNTNSKIIQQLRKRIKNREKLFEKALLAQSKMNINIVPPKKINEYRTFLTKRYDVSIYYPNVFFTKKHLDALFPDIWQRHFKLNIYNTTNDVYYANPMFTDNNLNTYVRKTLENIDNYYDRNQNKINSSNKFNNDIQKLLSKTNNNNNNNKKNKDKPILNFILKLQELQRYEREAFQAIATKASVLMNMKYKESTKKQKQPNKFCEGFYNPLLLTPVNYLIAAYENLRAYLLQKKAKSFDRFFYNLYAYLELKSNNIRMNNIRMNNIKKNCNYTCRYLYNTNKIKFTRIIKERTQIANKIIKKRIHNIENINNYKENEKKLLEKIKTKLQRVNKEE